MNLIDEIEGLGFINGTIDHNGYQYAITLINVEDYITYSEMVTVKDSKPEEYFKALEFVCSKCLYRTKIIKPWWKILLKKLRIPIKYEEVKVYDFDLLKYPYVMLDRFSNDLFKVVVDETFMQRLIQLKKPQKMGEQE